MTKRPRIAQIGGPFALLLILVTAAFLFGGGARGDIVSLVLLRPLSVGIFAVALWRTSRSDLRQARALVGFAFAAFLLALVHAVPLPPVMWQALPNRDVIQLIERAVGHDGHWRPISIAPEPARNALLSLFLPIGFLLLLTQVTSRQRVMVGVSIVALCLLSGLLGLVQASGVSLGFYRISTANGGLFANHNHQAVILAAALPLAAWLAGERRELVVSESVRIGIGALCFVVFVAGTVVAGSRAGLALLLFGLLSGGAIVILNRSARSRAKSAQANRGLLIAFSAGAVLSGAAMIWLISEAGRSQAINRAFGGDLAEEARWPTWRTTASLVREYLPFGSGNGSFVEAFKIGERSDQLRQAYMNHAHNDFLEVALTLGLPGIALLVGAFAAFVLTLQRLLSNRSNGAIRLDAVAGISAIVIIGASSVVDYPARVPSISCLFIYAAYLAQLAWRPNGTSQKNATR